ncbi:winged helix-turn-helix domain-containing protein [Halotalea alkalilenta]|uniref:winged helix-turn-helix domain-containing protein n=1 Tax=Halotalea alkalilenta TaxID=376489 RepID=UPI000ACF749C
MSVTISKTRSSFYRRLYVAWLIDQGIASVPSITAFTGMPRRTAQDTVAALDELDIQCAFEQREGARHQQGEYVIRDWGAIQRDWVSEHIERIAAALGYPVPE